jgi:hypothetical protein
MNVGGKGSARASTVRASTVRSAGRASNFGSTSAAADRASGTVHYCTLLYMQCVCSVCTLRYRPCLLSV